MSEEEKGYTTTEEHFRLFQEESEKWIDFFGLKDWSVRFFHHEDKGDDAGLAWLTADPENRWASLVLNKYWHEHNEPTNEFVRRQAFHEVCELLLYRIRSIAGARYCQPEEVDEAVHAVIRTLENTVWKQDDRGRPAPYLPVFPDHRRDVYGWPEPAMCGTGQKP